MRRNRQFITFTPLQRESSLKLCERLQHKFGSTFKGIGMPFNLSWYDEQQTIIYIQVEGKIPRWEENNEAFLKAWGMGKTVTHPFYVLVHADAEARMPPGNPLPHISNNLSIAPDNMEMLITIVSSPFERTIMEIIIAANKRHRFYDRLVLAPSLPQALALIDKRSKRLNQPPQTSSR